MKNSKNKNGSLETVGAVLLIIGAIVASLATVTSIGYALYLWGALGGALGASMWTGFVLWMKMAIGGIVAIVIGMIMGDIK